MALFRCSVSPLGNTLTSKISPVGCAARTATPPACIAKISNRSKHQKSAGFSYVEVLIATLLIAVTLVPAMDALLPASTGSSIHESRGEDHYRLNGRLQEVLAEPFASLDAAALVAGSPTTASSYSDVYTYADGRQITRNIFISRYDGDNADADNNPFTGGDEGLLWLRAVIAGSALSIETLTSEYD